LTITGTTHGKNIIRSHFFIFQYSDFLKGYSVNQRFSSSSHQDQTQSTVQLKLGNTRMNYQHQPKDVNVSGRCDAMINNDAHQHRRKVMRAGGHVPHILAGGTPTPNFWLTLSQISLSFSMIILPTVSHIALNLVSSFLVFSYTLLILDGISIAYFETHHTSLCRILYITISTILSVNALGTRVNDNERSVFNLQT